MEITDGERHGDGVFRSAYEAAGAAGVPRRNTEYKDFDTEVTVFAKYRDVGGGVKWPFDVRRDRNGEKIFEMYRGVASRSTRV